MLVAGGISAGVTVFKEKNTAVSQQKKSASATKKSNKTENQKNSQDESSKQNVLTEAAASEETLSGDTLAKADFLAQQYNYDKAIDLLKNDPDYGSSQKMQNAVKKYEETKAIVKNSAMKIMFKQDIMDSAYIRTVTKLTATQISQVTQLGGTIGLGGSAEKKRKGECCLIDNNDNVVFVKVDYLTRTEAKICETDPAEIAKMMAVPVRRGMVG